MPDIFFIIILVISLGIFGGIIYIIYLPFKNRLIKSGKLTKKINRQINWTFILSLFLVGVVFYSFKEYRTSSRERLEKVSDLKLPTDIKVLNDEYQDMGQDYCILYNIQFDDNSMTEIIENIKKSKFYNENAFHKGDWTENDFIMEDSVMYMWRKSPKGFDFNKPYGLTTYHIELDTVTKILKYKECAK